MEMIIIDNVPPEASAVAIRDAILKHIPQDDNIQRDIKVHDGMVDIYIKWRTMRWSASLGISSMSPDQLGRFVASTFRDWMLSILNSPNTSPRHAAVLREMEQWLLGQREGVWADVERRRNPDGLMKWGVKVAAVIDAPQPEEVVKPKNVYSPTTRERTSPGITPSKAARFGLYGR